MRRLRGGLYRGHTRTRTIGEGEEEATQGRMWMPARLCAAKFPWLAGFSKLDLVLKGLDQEAVEMGLAAHAFSQSAHGARRS
jgi:hypothetical protein